MNCHYRFFSLESFFADAQAAGYKAVEICADRCILPLIMRVMMTHAS